jgi:hypothetical protein
MDPRRRREWLDALLAQREELFHVALFQNLIDAGLDGELSRLQSPFLEDFLRADDRTARLIIDLRAARGQFDGAARGLARAGLEAEGAAGLPMLQRARGLARHLGDVDSATTIASEIRFRNAEANSEDAPAENAVRVLAAGRSVDVADDVAKARWKDYFIAARAEGWSEDRIAQFVMSLPPDSPVLRAEVVVRCFEDWRFARWGARKPVWVPEFLTRVGVPGSRLYEAYAELIRALANVDIDPERIDQLVVAALWLLREGHLGDLRAIEDQVRTASQREPFAVEVLTMLEIIVS